MQGKRRTHHFSAALFPHPSFVGVKNRHQGQRWCRGQDIKLAGIGKGHVVVAVGGCNANKIPASCGGRGRTRSPLYGAVVHGVGGHCVHQRQTTRQQFDHATSCVPHFDLHSGRWQETKWQEKRRKGEKEKSYREY